MLYSIVDTRISHNGTQISKAELFNLLNKQRFSTSLECANGVWYDAYGNPIAARFGAFSTISY